MTSIKRFVTTQRLAIIGDGFLMTAAAFSLVIGVSTLVVAPTGTPAPGTEWLAALSSLLSMAVVVAVPILVWVLHGQRLSIMAVLGGFLGAASTALAFFGFATLSVLLGLAISPMWDSEFAGPLLMLIAVAAVCVAAVAWLVVAAIRDLATKRDHPWVDALRLLSASVLIVYTAGVTLWITSHPNDESIDALIFAMVAGISAALAVTGAEILTALSASRESTTTPRAEGTLDSTHEVTT